MKIMKLFTIIMLAALGLSLTVAAQEDEDELQPGLAMYVASLGTDLSAEPDRSAERLDQVRPGVLVTIEEVRDDVWAYVTLGDTQGWISTRGLINVTEEDLLPPGENLPAPSGPYQVGVTIREWTDESRQDPWSDDPDDKRMLAAWIYYPAEVEAGTERMPYLMDESLVPIFRFFSEEVLSGDFETVYSEINQWQAHAYRDVPVSDSEETYPVILSTGLLLRSLQAVDLASHGYIVVDIDMTRNHVGIEFQSEEFRARGHNFQSRNGQEDAVEGASATIDYLESLNMSDGGDALSGRLDLDNIGVMGISVFGGVAWEIANRDDRVTAGISIDGAFPFGMSDLGDPFMYMIIDLGQGSAAYRQSLGPAYEFRVPDFAHDTPTDWLFWPEVRTNTRVWPTGMTPMRAHKIYTTYFLAFYNRHLKGEEVPLLDGPSDDFPEVTIESRNTD